MERKSRHERFAQCAPPIPDARLIDGHLLPSEESASLWLWAWPSLLGWDRPVEWLFSPVVGNAKHPGDLWGIDDEGILLIVETKVDTAIARQDPLCDFCEYVAKPEVRDLWTSAELRKRWRRLFKQEMTFLREHFESFAPSVVPTGTYRGVVPYSRHRVALWRWQHLYRTQIAPRFEDGEYEARVMKALRTREENREPAPVFVGLIATTRGAEPQLSNQGRQAAVTLQSVVGRDHVLLRAIRPTDADGEVRICSWSIQ